MKKLFLTAFLGVVMMAGVGSVAAVSTNASPKSCFGQDRAAYALTGSETVGYWASMRKGMNAEMNHDYMVWCQSL